MIQSMEKAAGDDLAAYCAARAAAPETAPAASPETIIAEMSALMIENQFAGAATTAEDLARAGFSNAEIDRHHAAAARCARLAMKALASRGIRRARVPAGRSGEVGDA